MQKNKLGKSDLYVSEIGFGTMSLPQDEKTAINILHKAVDSGINFFDTADLYEFGRIETTVGKAFKGRRDDVILATKAGNHWEPGREEWYWDPSKDYIKSALKDSLKRLGTDYIDLFQLHGGTIEDPIDETIEAFEELKEEGYIRHYGISSIRPNVIRQYIDKSNIVSVLTQYSLLDRRPEETVLDLLKEHDIAAIVRGPVAKGLLTDQAEEKLSDKGYLDYNKEEIETVLTALDSPIHKGRNRAHTAMEYVLHHPAVKTVIPGASRLSQLKENCDLKNAPDFTNDEAEQLKEASKPSVYQSHV